MASWAADRPARCRQDIQPDDDFGIGELRAGISVGCLSSQRRSFAQRTARRAHGRDRREHRLSETGAALRRNARRGMARLSDRALSCTRSPPYLPKAVDDADFDFYGKVIEGKTAQLDRETRGVRTARQLRWAKRWASSMSRAISRRRPRRRRKRWLHNLLKAYAADIQTLVLDDAGDARQGAGEAAALSCRKVGYPDHWRDYSALAHRARRSRAATSRTPTLFEWNRELAPHRPAGGPQRMGHDAADQQRLLRSNPERDRVPGRHLAAALSSIPMPTMR